jgi:hypothetical protein
MELNEAREGWKKEGGREANPTYLDPICSPPPWLPAAAAATAAAASPGAAATPACACVEHKR